MYVRVCVCLLVGLCMSMWGVCVRVCDVCGRRLCVGGFVGVLDKDTYFQNMLQITKIKNYTCFAGRII